MDSHGVEQTILNVRHMRCDEATHLKQRRGHLNKVITGLGGMGKDGPGQLAVRPAVVIETLYPANVLGHGRSPLHC